jgi:hypothetical protein
MPDPVEIHFVYFQGCPIADKARTALSLAIRQLELDCEIVEVDTAQAESHDPLARLPSPSILVNGRELYGESHGEASCCRVYPAGSLSPRELAGEIRKALEEY